MKKTLFAAASLMMFAACSNTEDVLQNDKVANEGRLVTVTTTLPGDTPDSRVVLTEENPDTDNRKIKVEWKESGETFSVMTATSTATQTFTQTEGSNEFTGELTADWTQPYYAFYPAVTSATDATAVPYDLSTQTGALSETTNYMYAVNTTDGKEYNFQHLTAIVKFTLNLPENYTPTSLSLVSDRLLAKGTVNLTGETVKYTNELSAHSITVKNPKVTAGKITLYLHVSPMAASADSKNTLHIRTHSGSKGYSGSISTSKEIKAGKYYTATVDVTTHDYDYTDVSIFDKSYKVYSPWGLRAWGENTSMFAKCTLGDNDIDMGTLPNDIEMVGFAGNWTTTNKSGKNQMFDGNNKTISNLRVVGGYQSRNDTYVGFIGQLGQNATFKDVTFKGSTVAVVSGKYTYVGIAMGTTTGISGTVSGVTIEPNPDSTDPVFRISVSDNNDRITLGAVIGYTGINQIVKNCINNQDLAVTGINDDNTITCYWLMIGGISGFANKDDLFLQCVNNGNIELKDATTNSQKLIGGIVSTMGNGIFVACANTGSITAPKDYVISGIGYSPNYANYGCYSDNHAVTASKTYTGSFNGFYDSVSTNLDGVTKVTEFNTDEVVNGMNAALVTYNNTADLADAKKCDKHWEKSNDPNYSYPVLVEGAPTPTTE
ncbi:MAG: hypothetical protein IJ413_11620 [Bacteroides sp.]|nr:hypothetical protein [Bacteroides sp.]